MNKFKAIDVDYLRPDKTIETILVSNHEDPINEKTVYVYNYRGVHFRLFENILEIISFLENKSHQVIKEFTSDDEVDYFLANMKIQ